jgi:hypothetical protein
VHRTVTSMTRVASRRESRAPSRSATRAAPRPPRRPAGAASRRSAPRSARPDDVAKVELGLPARRRGPPPLREPPERDAGHHQRLVAVANMRVVPPFCPSAT